MEFCGIDSLLAEVKTGTVDAFHRDGLLVIALPKVEKISPKEISVGVQ